MLYSRTRESVIQVFTPAAQQSSMNDSEADFRVALLPSSCRWSSFIHTSGHTVSFPYVRTHLAGADLPVDICLLADAVLQVWDVRLQPCPPAYDGGSFPGEAAFRSSPPEARTQKQTFKTAALTGPAEHRVTLVL